MFSIKKLLILQIICAFTVTFIAYTAGSYFPNLPPFVRAIIPKGMKGGIKITEFDPSDSRFLEWFNRDPDRTIPSEPNIIVSPADGYVRFIKVYKGMKHVVIEMRYTDVHVQRIPLDGVVVMIEGDGKELKGDNIGDYTLDKMMPFQKVTTIETEIGPVKIHQITSYFAKRVQVFVELNEKVKRGQRLGRILAGSTIVIEVPKTVSVMVKKNQEVLGGETIIGKY